LNEFIQTFSDSSSFLKLFIQLYLNGDNRVEYTHRSRHIRLRVEFVVNENLSNHLVWTNVNIYFKIKRCYIVKLQKKGTSRGLFLFFESMEG